MTTIDWGQVQVGDLVLGGDGKEWEVLDATAGGPLLQRVEDGLQFRGAPRTATVERVATAAQVHERALAVAQVRLGGEAVAEQDAKGSPWRVPATWHDAGALAAHIHLMHGGEYTGWPDPGARTALEVQAHDGTKTKLTRAQLVQMHDALHEEMASSHAPARTTPHVHDPDFFKRLRST